MPDQSNFTGRVRGRRSAGRVRLADAVARAVITLGGIGTIVAVLLVGLFLLAVALPLFRPAATGVEAVLPPAGGGVAWLGCDESAAVAWIVPVGDDGVVQGDLRLVSLKDGRTVQVLPATEAGLAGATAIRALPGGPAAVGFADGRFRVGRLGVMSTFVGPERLPAAARDLPPGEAVATDSGVFVRGLNGHHAATRLEAVFESTFESGGERIIDVDVVQPSAGMLSSGLLVAALDSAGGVRLESVTRRWNLLTDTHSTVSEEGTIPPVDGFRPRYVRVSELGDQLFLVADDGRVRRYQIRAVTAPVLMESFTVAAANAAEEVAHVTAVERLFGGLALAVGDATGTVRVLVPARSPAATAPDGQATQVTREFPATGAAVTAIAGSPRSRLFAVADARGTARLLQSTAGRVVAEVDAAAALDGGPTRLMISPRENRLLASGTGGLAAWSMSVGHPEVSWRTLLRPVWYEGYPGPVHAWETTGHDAFESKFGLVPLIFGTIKATLYAMLFATPVAILAAVYTSQFMHPRWRARIKPTIEMMASLPSVVLGFIAGLVFAPLLEGLLMPVLAGVFVVPLAILSAAHLWQLLPAGLRTGLSAWRFPLVGLVAMPAGLAASLAAGPAVERLLFQGDVRAWLDGRDGSGFGGWVLATLPLTALAAVWIVGRLVNPWLRRAGAGWSPRRAGLASLLVFVCGGAAAVLLAVAAAAFCDALRLDTRGGLFGSYVQRNALVVAVGMGFAIIPLVFTIADDALSSVPEHLRSASLGAGATPWQTTVRVIVPAAASGLFSAVMIGLGRAVGETMIVLMAAGNTPLVSWNLFDGFQTLSAAIATELPEAARNSGHYRVLFLAALALFAMTFVVNTCAEVVRQRFRRRAHEL